MIRHSFHDLIFILLVQIVNSLLGDAARAIHLRAHT